MNRGMCDLIVHSRSKILTDTTHKSWNCMFRFSYLQNCARMFPNWKLFFSKNLEVSGSSAACTFCLSWTKMQLRLTFSTAGVRFRKIEILLSGSFWFQSPLYFAHVFTNAPDSEADGMLFWRKCQFRFLETPPMCKQDRSIATVGCSSRVASDCTRPFCGWQWWLAWIKMLCHLPQKTPDAQRSSNTCTVSTAEWSYCNIVSQTHCMFHAV